MTGDLVNSTGGGTHQGTRGKSSQDRSVRGHRGPTGWLQSRAKRTAASPGKDTEGPGPGVLLPGTWGRRPRGLQPPVSSDTWRFHSPEGLRTGTQTPEYERSRQHSSPSVDTARRPSGDKSIGKGGPSLSQQPWRSTSPEDSSAPTRATAPRTLKHPAAERSRTQKATCCVIHVIGNAQNRDSHGHRKTRGRAGVGCGTWPLASAL